MAWTRRRCNACGQVLVEEEAVVASCPACGAPVGMDSVIPETPPEPEEPIAAAQDPDEPPSESAPEPSLPHDWNLGEPMHRVFWFCLAAPDRVPLATMFRSLRWVFSMAWIGQVVLQMSFLMIGAAMLQAGAQELSLLREVSEAMSAYEQGGPEARRQRVAKEQMCTLTMLTPEQRLLCALQPALGSLRDVGEKAAARVQAIEQLRGPQHLDAWLRTIGDGLIGVFFSFIPLWGLLGMARHPSAWSTALKVMAFGQVPLVLCGVVSALAMTLGGSIGLSIGMMVLISGVLWSLSLWVGFLIRIGSLPARQSVVMVLMILLFNFTLLTTVAGLN